jgi:hypothetical protein
VKTGGLHCLVGSFSIAKFLIADVKCKLGKNISLSRNHSTLTGELLRSPQSLTFKHIRVCFQILRRALKSLISRKSEEQNKILWSLSCLYKHFLGKFQKHFRHRCKRGTIGWNQKYSVNSLVVLPHQKTLQPRFWTCAHLWI